ncbi:MULTISPECIES: hypothetical protein [Paenibacillus]|uniref:hypothetical protein n=1 Tax=Paenibacillus TaxID=44249 RepID=UPI00117D6FED|nr:MULTISPECIES: hypothetical protein [Paenibacillus]UYO06834.1 hypothetical protein K2F33_13750 [Paenibacillus sp. PSB04]
MIQVIGLIKQKNIGFIIRRNHMALACSIMQKYGLWLKILQTVETFSHGGHPSDGRAAKNLPVTTPDCRESAGFL